MKAFERKFVSRAVDLLWRAFIATVTLCLFASNPVSAIDSNLAALSYVDRFPNGKFTVIDVRPEAHCQSKTVRHAICIPQEHIISPAARLANFSGLLWLLGTAGLDGSERVLVAGDKMIRKEFIAGVLHLAGQAQIQVLTTSIKSLLESGQPAAAGRSRSNIRLKVFKSPMRSGQIILRNELMHQLSTQQPLTILDGRTEAEYWGHLIHGSRGGHLPGAIHSPLSLRDNQSPFLTAGSFPVSSLPDRVVVYAHDNLQSIAYYARLIALGVSAQVLHEGWAGWAQDGQLPVDSASYPARRKIVLSPEEEQGKKDFAANGFQYRSTLLKGLLVMVLLLSVAAIGFAMRRRGGIQHD